MLAPNRSEKVHLLSKSIKKLFKILIKWGGIGSHLLTVFKQHLTYIS